MLGTTRNVVSLDSPRPERRTRVIVSLDPPTPPSSSSESVSWDSILDSDVGQVLLSRRLDRMSAHMSSMQLQLDRLNVEVAYLKRHHF